MTASKSGSDSSRAKKPAAKKTAPARRRRRHSGPKAAPASAAPVPEGPRPSSAPRGIIVVDGSNVANASRREGRPRLENIQRVHDILVREGFEPVIFVDASLRHQIPEEEKGLFEDWEGRAFIVQTPRGVNGDEAVLEFASRHHAAVLSNDNYQDLEARFPWVRDRSRRIPYNLVRGELIMYRHEAPPAPPAAPTPAPSEPGPRAPRIERTGPAKPMPPKPRSRPSDIPRASESEWNELKDTLVRLFEAKVPPGESIRADQLSEETRRALPGFRPNYYGSSTFTRLLDRMDDVFELARRGPDGQMASLEGPQRWPIVVLRRGG